MKIRHPMTPRHPVECAVECVYVYEYMCVCVCVVHMGIL